MASKYLDLAGLSVFKNKMVGLIPTKTSDLSNDSNFAVDASYVHTDNNYTSTEKSKLSGIAAGAQVNKIESIKVNGTAQTITSKAVDITVPTKTSDLTNDSGFLTSHQDISGKVNKTGDTMTGQLTTPKLAVGDYTTNLGNNSVAIGEFTGAGGKDAFSSGSYCEATANYSHAEGIRNTTNSEAQHIQGKWSINDGMQSMAHIVGNGEYQARSNCHTLAWDGTAWFAGDVYTGSTSGTNKDSGSKKLATVDLIPTNNNQLTNGAGYQTASQVQTAIDEALAGVTGIDFQVVQTLPSTGVKGTIYLISNSGSSTNAYDEYIYVNNSWEKIGTTDVDLTEYMKFTDMVAITTSEINALFA